MKVIIIDDNKTLTDTIKESLESYDSKWNVNVYYNGKSALEDIPTFMPDIMFIDITLPSMSGLDILKEVKEIDDDIQVIIMTAYPTVDNIITALRYGALDFIQKPIHMKDIISVLKTAANKRKVILDSRGAIAHLIKYKEHKEEKIDMFSLLDRTLIINNFQKKTGNVSNENDFIGCCIDELADIVNTPYIYFYKFDNEKPIRLNSISKKADNEMDDVVKSNIEQIISSKRMNINDKDIIAHISFEKNNWGFIIIKRGYDFKYMEMETVSMLSIYIALKLKQISIIRNTDSKLAGLILAIMSVTKIEDANLERIIEMTSSISAEFAEYLNLDIEKIEQIRYAAFLYNYLGSMNNGNNIKSKQTIEKVKEYISNINEPLSGIDFESKLSSITEQILFLNKIKYIIDCIEEHYDGTGKKSINGEDIPYDSRLLAITTYFVKIFISMSSKKDIDTYAIMEGMNKLRNKQFDGKILELFTSFIEKNNSNMLLSISKE